jgi:polyisoprenoid-binding protein YceI
MSTWKLDKAHTTIEFKVKHLMVSSARGSFTLFEGTITSPDDSFENAQAEFTAQTASVTTNNDIRDGHLKSAEFFDVEKFPTISFVSKSFTKKGSGFEIIGDLTMKGVTKEITFSATTEGVGTGMDGGRIVGFDITGSINRQDFGLSWNKTLETGGAVVGDIVTLDIHVEAKEE